MSNPSITSARTRTVKPAGKGRLLLSLWASDWQPGAFIALLILALSLMTTVAPRAVDAMFTQELSYATGSTLGDAQRSLSARVAGAPNYSALPDLEFGLSAVQKRQQIERLQSFLLTTKIGADDLLESMMGEPQSFSMDTEKLLSDPDPDAVASRIVLAADPDIRDRVELVDGRLPSNSEEFFVEHFGRFLSVYGGLRWDQEVDERIGQAVQRPIADYEPVELMLHQRIAERMDWQLGERRSFESVSRGTVDNFPLELVGIFVETDPDDLYWRFAPNSTDPFYFNDFDRVEYYSALGYVDPWIWNGVAHGNTQTVAWYPLDASSLDTSNAGQLLLQLNSFVSKNYMAGDVRGAPLSIKFSSETRDRLESVIESSDSIGALITMITAGPLAAGILVLVLSNRLIVTRRRPHLALITARGGTVAKQRWLHFVEGFSVALLPAAIGALLSAWWFHADGESWLPRISVFDVIVVLGLAATYGLLLAFAVKRFPLTDSREDLELSKKHPVRRLIELIVVLISAGALYLFLNRGFTIVPGLGVDPVLALLPLLLLAGLTILMLRIYPIPLHLIHRSKRRSKNISGFLGSARAIRESSGGLLPLLATILALSITIFSAVMLSTVHHAGERKAWLDVGADLQISGISLIDRSLPALAELDWVDEIIVTGNTGRQALRTGSREGGVSAIIADFEQLAKVQAGSPWALDLSAVTVGGDQAELFFDSRLNTDASSLRLNNRDVSVAGTARDLPGYGGLLSWVLLDESEVGRLLIAPVYDKVLIKTNDHYDFTTASQEIHEIIGQNPIITTPELALDRLYAQPTVIGLNIALTAASILGTILALCSLVLFSFTMGASRKKLFPLLTSLGVQSKSRRSLLAWEIIPVAVTALITSIGAGFGLAFLMVTVLNLSGFTGGERHPGLALDYVTLGIIIGTFIIGIVGTILLNLALMKRLDLSKVLRS